MFEPFYRKTERYLTKYVSSIRDERDNRRKRAQLAEWIEVLTTSMNAKELEHTLYLLYKSAVPVPSVAKHLYKPEFEDDLSEKYKEESEYRGLLWMVQDEGTS